MINNNSAVCQQPSAHHAYMHMILITYIRLPAYSCWQRRLTYTWYYLPYNHLLPTKWENVTSIIASSTSDERVTAADTDKWMFERHIADMHTLITHVCDALAQVHLHLLAVSTLDGHLLSACMFLINAWCIWWHEHAVKHACLSPYNQLTNGCHYISQ